MPRNVTLFTGQWADLSLPDLAAKASHTDYDSDNESDDTQPDGDAPALACVL